MRLDTTFGGKFIALNHCLTAALRLRKRRGVLLHCVYLETSEKYRLRSQSEKLETSFRVPWDPGGPFLEDSIAGCELWIPSLPLIVSRARAKNTVEAHIPYIICPNSSSYKSGQ